MEQPVRSARGQKLSVLRPNRKLALRVAGALKEHGIIADPLAVAYTVGLPGATFGTVLRYLNPHSYAELTETVLPRYNTLKDFEAAADRLADAVVSCEPIGISGDYDCDGNCSTALMIRFLQESEVPPDHIHVHIPNRENEGYGVNRDAVQEMADKNPPVKLLVTVDNGTLAHKPLEAAHAKGMDTIVIDHHPNSAGHALPKGLVVNPRRADEIAAIKADVDGVGDLAAAGVTWLICRRAAQMLFERGHYKGAPPDPRNWLGLVATATQADVVNIASPLNRALVKEGLNVINEGKDPYISALARVAQVQGDVSETDISFNLGPIINAPGRLGQSVAWAFLAPPNATSTPMEEFIQSADAQTSELHAGLKAQYDHLKAQRFAETNALHDKAMASKLRYSPRQSDDVLRKAEEEEKKASFTIDPKQYALMVLAREANNLRKLIEAAVTREARPQARRILEKNPDTSVLMLHGEGWHEGVVGIVAGRMKEEFNLPTIVASVLPPNEHGEVLCKASARSIKVEGHPVDIGQAIRDISPEDGIVKNNTLMRKGGGHPMAAGCTFDYANLEAVRTNLDTALKPQLSPAKAAQKTMLAGTIDMSKDHAAAIATLQTMVKGQQYLRPFGEGSRPPMIGLYGCTITPPQIMGRSSKHLQSSIATKNGVIAITAFHAVGTRLEKSLRDAAQQPGGSMHMLIGTLEMPKASDDNAMPTFQLQDILTLPLLRGQTPADALIANKIASRNSELAGLALAGNQRGYRL